MIATAALLAAAALGQAPAEDVAGCVRRMVPPGDVARLQAQMVAEIETGEKHPDTVPLLRALVGAAATCRPGEDRRADAQAGRLVVATIAAEAMRARLAAAGGDMDAVDGVLAGAPQPVRAAFLAKKFGDPAVGALSRAVIAAAGEIARDAALRRLLGGYALNSLRVAERGGA